MRIYTIWEESDEDEMPWLVDATDEYTIESNDGFPESYSKALEAPRRRQVIIEVSDKVISELFVTPTTKGTAA